MHNLKGRRGNSARQPTDCHRDKGLDNVNGAKAPADSVTPSGQQCAHICIPDLKRSGQTTPKRPNQTEREHNRTAQSIPPSPDTNSKPKPTPASQPTQPEKSQTPTDPSKPRQRNQQAKAPRTVKQEKPPHKKGAPQVSTTGTTWPFFHNPTAAHLGTSLTRAHYCVFRRL